MKRLNNVGFTLIELLAVITIMGILLMVAVPSVSRTIENSRRDTFADNAMKYIDTIRTAVLADEIICKATIGGTEVDVTASGTPDGTYYFKINTLASDAAYQQTSDIMEKVAKSAWGGNDIQGYVKWTRTSSADVVDAGGNVIRPGRTTTKYYVRLADGAGHGFKEEVEESFVSRSKIFTSGATPVAAPAAGNECTLK